MMNSFGAGEAPTVVVLSPHLDDAALSAWSVLHADMQVRVVTVFAGIPGRGFVTALDRAHGAEESAEWLRLRREQDRAVLARAECEPVHLDLLEVQFPAWQNPAIRDRITRDPDRFLEIVADDPELGTDPDDLAELMLAHIPDDAMVYGPAGIGHHPDHRDLAAAAVRLIGRVRTLRLYADSPYYFFRGLPSLVGNTANGAADTWVRDALRPLGLDLALDKAQVARLDDETFAAKQAALRGYRTEWPLVVGDMERLGIEPQWMRFETFWGVPDARC
jgi:hypothetical protein